MSYFTLKDKISDLKTFVESADTPLPKTGISALNGLISIKKGYPWFVGGAPFSGKTEFVFEILVNTSKMYGWKHFIYCGEGGNIEHIFNELIHKFLEKLYKFADEKEKIYAEMFINEHFIIADHDKDYTIDDFYDLVNKTEVELGIKFSTTMFDPFNDIEDESDKFGGRDDKFLAYALKKCRISSKLNDRVDILVNHIADVKATQDKDTGNWYMRPALPNEWAGGRTWWRRAFTMILIYRPPEWLKNEDGKNYEPNETLVIIQKAKPKGVGKLGRASIYWDWKKNRYYSYSESGQLLYSCQEQTKKELLPNEEFFENKNDLPF